jgi:hypothetical protein
LTLGLYAITILRGKRQVVDINCLVCEERIDLPKYIDTQDYDGEVVCQKCESLLHVKLVKSKVRKYRVVEKKFRTPAPDEVARIYKAALEEFQKSKNE